MGATAPTCSGASCSRRTAIPVAHSFRAAHHPPQSAQLRIWQQKSGTSSRATCLHGAGISTHAVSEQDDLAHMADWLRQRGGGVDRVTLGDFDMGGFTVRGLVATETLPQGSALITVPLACTLRDDNVPEAYPGAPWNVNMAAFLMEQRAAYEADAGSEWSPYIASLPAGVDGPLTLTETEVDAIQYPQAVRAVRAYRAFARDAYEQWESHQQGQQGGDSWDRFVWALHMVQSRTIRLAVLGCRAMIPAVDMLNHGGPSGAVGSLALGSASWQSGGERSVMFITNRVVEAGEQVLWSYGARCNDDFFVYHGFGLADNQDEDVVLFDTVQECAEWAAHALAPSSGCGVHTLAAAGAAAATAAAAAWVGATARCAAPQVPGTSSSLMVPARTALDALAASESAATSATAATFTTPTTAGCGEQGAAAAAALARAANPLTVTRRLASFRLHQSEWGLTAAPQVPELVMRRDGCADVRLLAALAAAAGVSASGAPHDRPLSRTVSLLLTARVLSLLEDYPTTEAEDATQMQGLRTQAAGGAARPPSHEGGWGGSGEGGGGGGAGGGGGVSEGTVAYRLGKKTALAACLLTLE
ncbi:hypothetical protein FOA52_009456 [Chlamydomonas sp. UWO 241]|nr:hypothetical protein FOA52_009456 [Chlamydomonas sp. UWO 241]